jgi:predicted glycosyltransferase
MSSSLNPKRAMIWFESHLGAGDAKLSFNLADGLARNGYEVYIASSSVERWKHIFNANEHIHVIDLPSLDRRQDQHYYTPSGTKFPDDKEYVNKRREALLRTLHNVDPSLVVTQGWPLGRNHFDEEVLGLMDAVKAKPTKPLLVSYPFDVNYVTADDKGHQPGRKAQFMEQFTNFDKILIPGNQILDYIEPMPFLEPFRDKLVYAGYFVDSFDTRPKKPQEEVLVCSGGGWHNSDLPFYLGAIHSRKYTEAKDSVWRVKVSRKLCSEAMYEKIVQAAREEDPTGTHIIVEANDDKFQQQMVNAKLLIIRAGYNTITEAVHARKHVITFPRPFKGFDREQEARARALQKLGYVHMVTQPELETMVQAADYQKIAHAIDLAIHDPVETKPPLDTNGADNAARVFASLIDERYANTVPTVDVTRATADLAIAPIPSKEVAK